MVTQPLRSRPGNIRSFRRATIIAAIRGLQLWLRRDPHGELPPIRCGDDPTFEEFAQVPARCNHRRLKLRPAIIRA